ncbi:hypothetical protein FA15DRAFT_670431 [Coprinopsis marcescibilis]|uniref:Ubiquitin-like domain-containing protein n=1 Tax=Coprinopsis marcescibilis TaxID=230819 RepID=A0A5C3KTB9_COPMA|nr:hypothetical protein FA15DRAFT_670431 [Coprinopsis marcescibilis]
MSSTEPESSVSSAAVATNQAQAQATPSANAVPTSTPSTEEPTTLTAKQLKLLQSMSDKPTDSQTGVAPPSNEIPTQEQDSSPPAPETTIPDLSPPAPEPLIPQTPQTYLTFLLISGKRKTMSFEPETAVGRVKELVWNAWPSDWQDERPPAPSYLRILYLGKILQDDETLSSLKLPTNTPAPSTPLENDTTTPSSSGPPVRSRNAPTGTIVHISIRPYAPVNEAESSTFKKKRRGTRDSSVHDEPNNQDNNAGCCGCVIC